MRLDHLLSKESDKPVGLDLAGLDRQGIVSIVFNFEGPVKRKPQNNVSGAARAKPWGYSSAGRAPALQAGGQGFDSLYLHHYGLIAQMVRARA